MTGIAVFPGQGSQTVGMGKDLFDRFPDICATADRVLGYPIRELCLGDPERKLGRTEFTQPALFTVNALHYMAHLADGASVPDFVAGHSLGEYNALLAAEAFDFETGLRLVQKRGALMGAISGGGMAAVLGADAGRVRAVIQEAGISTVDVANFNAISQTVLSGPSDDLERLRPSFESAGANVVPLNVRTAFHSRYMRSVARDFAAFLDTIRFMPLVVPVISNFTALPYRDDEIANNLVKQIDHSVRWVESVQYLLDEPDPVFVELGPGTVLTRLIKDIRQHPTPVNIARRY
ncbi:ACP S-malonyltransferase [Marinivivus vitaminiproducens]|uniref:ACP S-malonyltransferase n=1 Tax=Marinivivus vitaminiproducens TaxID=3035935 RepID=UPI00279F059D|nr:ACP S-malonyltransferase [Geminicoccaceae bacterium SCSIO 64248]